MVKYKINCVVCNKEIITNIPNKKYCSEECILTVYKRKHGKEKCKECGKEFQKKSEQHVYCSKKCREAVRLKNMHCELDDLREYIFERDIFTCQNCGIKGSFNSLHVHHILPLYKGGDNSEKNLESLCHKCHMEKHHVW